MNGFNPTDALDRPFKTNLRITFVNKSDIRTKTKMDSSSKYRFHLANSIRMVSKVFESKVFE